MKTETILDAATSAIVQYYTVYPHPDGIIQERRLRQYRAFRARIIRLDERNKMRIAELEGHIYALNLYIEEKEMDREKPLVKGCEP